MVSSEVYYKVEQIRFASSFNVSGGRGEIGVGKVREKKVDCREQWWERLKKEQISRR